MLTAYFNGIEKIILANISKATSSVKIAVAWFTNPKIFTIIDNLFEKGIQIQIIVADDKSNFILAKNYFQKLFDNKIEVRVTCFPHLMHHKFCIVDDSLLITGSYNWTKNAEVNNHENIILTNERLLVDKYREAYSNLLQITTQVRSIELNDFSDYDSFKLQQQEIKLLLSNEEIEEINDQIEDKKEKLPDAIFDLLDDADILYLGGKYETAIGICEKVLETYPSVADAHEIIATCKWRQKKYNEQIKHAQEAVEIDNKFYSAYNILGIGYSHISNAQKSIDNYNICITAEQDNYVYYRNRAISYIDLERASSVPKNLRDQFTTKADKDLHKVIELTNKAESTSSPYRLYYSRGVAKFLLNQINLAKGDFLKAEKIYEATSKNDRDVYEYKEIKSYLKDIQRDI